MTPHSNTSRVQPGVDITVDRAALLDALAAMKTVLPRRPAAPVLAGIRLEAADGHLTLSAFDYDVSARVRIDATVTTPGRMLIHGRLLHDLIKGARGRDVTIRAEGSKAIVQPGPSRFELQTLPVEDYPVLPDFPGGGGQVYVQQFIEAVKRVCVATDSDGTIPMLTGIRIEFDGPTMVLVATDRFRVATAELTWFPDDPAAELAPVLIPGRVLKLLLSRWGKATGRLRIGHAAGEHTGEGLAGIALGSDAYTCRLMSGEFVKYKSLFPAAYTAGVVVETQALREAATLIGQVADRTSPIRLCFGHGQVVVEAGAGDEAQASETVPAIYDGDPFSVSFNPAFLLDALAVTGRGFVRLAFTAPSKPAVITGHLDPAAGYFDGFRYLMMPLRVPGQTAAPEPEVRPEPEQAERVEREEPVEAAA